MQRRVSVLEATKLFWKTIHHFLHSPSGIHFHSQHYTLKSELKAHIGNLSYYRFRKGASAVYMCFQPACFRRLTTAVLNNIISLLLHIRYLHVLRSR